MLSRSNRISKKLFPNTSTGKVFSNNDFSLRLLVKNGSTEEFKASVVVSKKVAKTAVKRNLLRRRIYSVIQKERANIPKGLKFVIYAKAGSADLPYTKVKEAINGLLRTVMV